MGFVEQLVEMENTVDGQGLTRTGGNGERADIVVYYPWVEFKSEAESVSEPFKPPSCLSQRLGVGSGTGEPDVGRRSARALCEGLHEGRPLHALHYIDVDDVDQGRVCV